MSALLYFGILVVGFVPLVYGADLLVGAASTLAKKMNIPNIVIGLTIVAFGTSAPELAVNVFGSIAHNSDIAFGNIIGSNIINILIILGLSSAICAIPVKNATTWIEIPLTILAAAVVFIAGSDMFVDGAQTGVITRSEGLLMLGFFVIFIAYSFLSISRGNDDEDIETKDYSKLTSILLILAGLALLLAGGRVIVFSAVKCAEIIGIPQRIIALTIVSLGTSLPELATSAVAAYKKNSDIAIGNIVGSNLFNTFFVLGISAVIYPVAVPATAFVDLCMNVLASVLLFAFVFTGKGRKIDRAEGIVFLLLYGGYLSWLIFSARM